MALMVSCPYTFDQVVCFSINMRYIMHKVEVQNYSLLQLKAEAHEYDS